MLTTPPFRRESIPLNRLLPESEIMMMHFGLMIPKKRGRPLKYGPAELPVTQELTQKRERLPLGHLNLAGTIISMLIKDDKLSIDEVEGLHKIFLLRKRYLSVVGLCMETKSQLGNLLFPKTKPTQRIHMNEDPSLEECWRNVAKELNLRDRSLIALIDTLFSVHSYDDLQQSYAHFIKRKPIDFSQSSKHCREAWDQQRGN